MPARRFLRSTAVRRGVLAVVACAAVLMLAPARALGREADDAAVVARAFDSSLTWSELDPLLLARHGMTKEGRDALRHLAESRVLETAAREQGIEVPAR